jgi:hypothetical protein
MRIARRSCLCLAILACLALAQEAWLARDLDSERITVARGAYFPRLVGLRNGDLLATYKYGAAHVGKSGKAGLSRSADGGRTWSATETIFDIADADDGVDATGELPDGSLLFGAVSYTWEGTKYNFQGWRADGYVLRSTDGGHRWTPPVKVDPKPFQWMYPFGTIFSQADGTILLSGYGGMLPMKEGIEDVSFLLRSHDGGKTWGDLSVIARRFNELCLIQLRDGGLLAVMRAQDGGSLSSAVSRDGGYHWSEPVRISRNNEHPPDLLRLRSGQIVLTYGQRNKPYGVEAIISADEGKTWNRHERVVLAWDGDHQDLGYPVTVQRRAGGLATIYYIVYGERDSEGEKGIAPNNAFTKLVLWNPPSSWLAMK